MAIEMSSPWIVGPIGAFAGAAFAWIASEYRTRKTYRGAILLLAKSADDFASMGQLDKALSIYDRILTDLPRLEPAVRGMVRFRQGLSRYSSSFQGARDTNLSLAVEAFEEAIGLFKAEKHPDEHARAQNGLGMSLLRLSETGGECWGDLAHRRERGGGDGPVQNLKRAIGAFEAALKIYSAQERASERAQERAQTENNLGDALVQLAGLEASGDDPAAAGAAAEDLNRAIEAYQAALLFRTRDDHPDDYAETRNSLGGAWMALARLEEGEERKAHLEKAMIDFKAALEVRAPASHPEDRAETQTLLGRALVLESEPEVSGGEIRWSDREGLKTAIEAYEEALTVRTRKDHPRKFAETKNLLGRALIILAGPARGPEDAANLRRAIRAFEEALEVLTMEACPLEYAEVQSNLGIAYRNLSKLEDRGDNLERSIWAYEEALRARSGVAKKKVVEKEGGGDEKAGSEEGDGGAGGL